MYIKCTKTLAKELNKKSPYTIECIKLSENEYRWHVGMFGGCYTDYDYNTDKYNIIRVIYPFGFYACDKYYTTHDLNRIFRNCDKTLDGFISEFNNETEI